MPRILAFAGSTRENSFNKRLVQLAADGARKTGTEVTYIDLRDFPMPIFDEDDEAKNGKPDTAKKLKRLMIEHDGFLIASPEYNSSVSAVLKNTIDWVSRPDEGEPPGALTAFTGKVVSLMSASPGGLGGLRGLVHLRAILGNIGCIVLPGQVAVGSAFQMFGEDGTLTDPRQQQAIVGLGKMLTATLKKLSD
jgi:chromate reductase